MATQHAAPGAFEGLDAGLDLYRRMLLIRRFEDLVQSLFLRGEVYGTTHLCSGQEAVAVGFASALGEGDRVACTYRGHGHLLARGLAPEALLGELLGRATGVNGGRAGSMNMVDLDHGVDRVLRDRRWEHRRRHRRGARTEGHRLGSRSPSSATARRTRRTSSSA